MTSQHARASQPGQDHDLIAIAQEFYRRGDAGEPGLEELFADDAQVYFPKFGIATGKHAIHELVNGLTTVVSSLRHLELDYLVAGRSVVVEGTTEGTTHDGGAWHGGQTPGGRFCSVFEFDDEGHITRMHVYLDPDYTSADRERFVWGPLGERRW
jgi:ketosteroid isomerase-like protein